MQRKSFRRYNLIFGWLSFVISATVYLLTIEPTTSLWDCGEFIASAYKLEVGHPPGAPLFMIVARFFSLFASDVAQVAKMVNAMSALASAFTILFLFWTITHLARKLLIKNSGDYTAGNIIAIIGSGLVGALAYTFSDTFWFSAVEGEVYATSSLFTALVFWIILKWENIANEKHANRWLILIAYLMGLSIGVHLLNLLAIPAIVFVYYFKKYQPTRKGIALAFLITIILIGSVMYGIIPGLIKMASRFELFFVNTLGMGFKSGVLIYAALLLASIIAGIYYTRKRHPNSRLNSVLFTAAFFLMGIPLIADSFLLALIITVGVYILVYQFAKNQHVVLNTILVSFAVIILGYSSFSMIVIRSLADPPMDENNPETVFSLLSYLNREQYGDRPLFFGHYYNAPIVDMKEGKPTYTQIGDRYEITNHKNEYVYDDRFMTLFPRMYSSNGAHVSVYKDWGNIKGKPIRVRRGNQEPEVINKPTFGENLRFFFTYQIGHMYMRYFLWNYAGKQNDIQSNGGILKGNWLTGINFLDEARLGPQDKLPDSLKNHPARNTYYMLPLLLGLLGAFFHFNKDKKDFSVVLLLFIFTGLAIVVYLNQTPNQPRERDYAYAGSFYAYAIWIGLGVLALFESLSKVIPKIPASVAVTLVALGLVPGIMAAENWHDHDRSGRYTARDLAYNYLSTCAPNAILFTVGDNDTFPLWYAQEVEGVRTDVRVVNLMLLNTDWYIEQMSRKAYESDPLPFSLTEDKYRQGTRDVVYITDRIKEYTNIDDIMKFVASDDPKTKLGSSRGEAMDYIPTKKFRLSVDKEKVLANGTVKPADADKIVDVIEWEVDRRHLGKADMMVLDILAQNDWERPVYYVSTGHSGTLGLEKYFQLEGYAYRLVPIEGGGTNYLDHGRIDTDIMYDNLMNKGLYRNMNDTTVYLDHFHVRTLSVVRLRNNFNRLADALIVEGKLDSAVRVLDKIVEITPHKQVPYDLFMAGISESYYKTGEIDKANRIVEKYWQISNEELSYYLKLEPDLRRGTDFETRVNLQVLQELNRITNTYGQDELNKKIQDDFNRHISTYSTIRQGAG
jgi:tetratricopeptide (TPR) repeat protein